jgi:hypothetical protein
MLAIEGSGLSTQPLQQTCFPDPIADYRQDHRAELTQQKGGGAFLLTRRAHFRPYT